MPVLGGDVAGTAVTLNNVVPLGATVFGLALPKPWSTPLPPPHGARVLAVLRGDGIGDTGGLV